jgi:hypothetical protein
VEPINWRLHPAGQPNHGHSVYAGKRLSVDLLGNGLLVGNPEGEHTMYKVVAVINDQPPGVYRIVGFPFIRPGSGFLPERPKGGDM